MGDIERGSTSQWGSRAVKECDQERAAWDGGTRAAIEGGQGAGGALEERPWKLSSQEGILGQQAEARASCAAWLLAE